MVGAFLRGEEVDEAADDGPQAIDCSRGCLTQKRLERGEGVLDRVEVGAVGGQVDQAGAGCLDRGANGCLLWLPRLSMRTVSPGASCGTRTCST